jgi:hypothetical protein
MTFYSFLVGNTEGVSYFFDWLFQLPPSLDGGKWASYNSPSKDGGN